MTIFISACDDGGSDSSSQSPARNETALTGRFVGGPVAGLKYVTATQSGFTDATGEFTYEPGERITFFVGDILLGEAVGADEVSIFDLAGLTPPTSSTDIVRMMRRKEASERATPFEVAANLAVFLQTVDEDADLENGIQIPSPLHTLADRVTIDFAKPWSEFARALPFRKLMADALDADLWSEKWQVRRTAYALDSLYSSLGLRPSIFALAEEQLDGHAEIRTIADYDELGNLARRESHRGTSEGCLFACSYLIPSYRVDIAYSARGDTLSTEVLLLPDTRRGRETYLHDSFGNLLSLEYTDADGNSARQDRYAYNAYWDKVSDPDGSRWEYVYSEEGRLESYMVNFGSRNPGRSARHVFTYEADGYVEQVEDERSQVTTLRYNLYDQLMQREYELLGSILRTVYLYDAAGNPVSREQYRDGDLTSRTVYTYDAAGNMISAESFDGAGRADLQTFWQYDENSNVVAIERFSRPEVPLGRQVFTYDSNGFAISTSIDTYGDGVFDVGYQYRPVAVDRWAVYFPVTNYCFYNGPGASGGC